VKKFSRRKKKNKRVEEILRADARAGQPGTDPKALSKIMRRIRWRHN
jgi:hypothetical protein